MSPYPAWRPATERVASSSRAVLWRRRPAVSTVRGHGVHRRVDATSPDGLNRWIAGLAILRRGTQIRAAVLPRHPQPVVRIEGPGRRTRATPTGRARSRRLCRLAPETRPGLRAEADVRCGESGRAWQDAPNASGLHGRWLVGTAVSGPRPRPCAGEVPERSIGGDTAPDKPAESRPAFEPPT
jgi:hypothetical protein